jgi:hypothetical protein
MKVAIALMMEAVSYCETSVNIHQTTRYNILKGLSLLEAEIS